jgi:cytochrome P450/NADPH-cytochrome P450 reductase
MVNNEGAHKIPQPPVRPLVGNAPDIDPEGPIQSMVRLTQQYGPIVQLTLPADASMVLLGSRELVADACDETRFEKHLLRPLQQLRTVVGDALFTAENTEPNWGKAHRILMPAFGPLVMRGYFDDMLDVAEQLFTKWERFGPEHRIDVTDDMTRLTLDTIALCGFGYRFNSFYQREMHPFVDAMVRVLVESGNRARRLPLQTQLMFLSQRQYEADASFMYGVTDELIARRRKAPLENSPRDLLSLMLNSHDPLTGERLDDTNIRQQLVTFLVAGHETTSGLLSFAVHLLLKNPEALAHVREQVDRVLGDEMPRFEHLAQLDRVDHVLRETLRLYPTAPGFSVHARQDTKLAGRYDVKKGDVFLVVIPALHRDPAVWREPDRFDPTRFEPAAFREIPDKAWLPFGNGQRSCIGRAFALQEATLVLAMLLQRFDIAEASPYTLKIKEALTMKPTGLMLRARVRRHVSRTIATRPSASEGPAAAPPTNTHGTPLLLLFGSNSGSSDAFARRIASDGQARGYQTRVMPLDDAAGRLPREGAVVIVASSYNGQPADNARAFSTWLAGVPAASLSGVRYAVFGCGNRDWVETWQAVPRRLDAQLQGAGAQSLMERGEADARGDFFGDFERWYAPFWETLERSLGVTAGPVASGPLYQVEVVPSAGGELVKQNRLDLATVTENRELVDLSSPLGRSKRHLELALPAGTSYASGD